MKNDSKLPTTFEKKKRKVYYQLLNLRQMTLEKLDRNQAYRHMISIRILKITTGLICYTFRGFLSKSKFSLEWKKENVASFHRDISRGVLLAVNRYGIPNSYPKLIKN